MKTTDYILIGLAAVAAMAMFDSTRVKRRFYLPVKTDANWNLAIANAHGLLTPAQYQAYAVALRDGTVSAVELNDGLVGLVGGK